MHSYQHNIKTFNNATRHLTRVERSLYRDLIELYYDTEQPLIAQIKKLERLVIAQTEEEKEALRYVLDEFFYLTGDVYTHTFCDEVIEAYKNNTSAKAAAGKASAAARKKKAEELKAARAKQNEQNSTPVQQPLDECSTNQKPETRNQKPISNTTHTSISSESDQCGGEVLEFSKKTQSVIPYQKIIECYQRILPSLPRVAKLSDARKSKIKARWNNDLPDLDEWAKYFMAVSKSDFLMGRASAGPNRSKPFQADIDFLISEANMIKVIEGKYHA